ncbi:MAG: hypothetical protein IJW32_01545 [Clostridia bacterium]|nr:hypothetical protein [Clostridia bacterium]
MDKKKVIVTFCEAGQGHIVTAEAIADSLEKKYADKIEVERAYIFRDSNDKDLQSYEKFAINEVKRANRNKFHLRMQLFAMKLFGEQGTLKLSFNVAFRKVKNKLIKIFEDKKADAIVSTYFAPYHISCCAKAKGKVDSLIVGYDPDHNVHGWWDRRGDIFITNNPDATKEAVEIRKFNKDTVKTVNFIARQKIVDCNESKDFFRKKYNIPQDKFAVILADGAYAAAKLEDFTDELLKTTLPITIIPVCGKNEKLLAKYTTLKDKMPENITLMPQPFLSDIHEYYKACDLFITKAGPNAITDCVFMNTPIMTNFYSGEIEKTSSNLFTNTYKAGVYCPDKKKARELVESYINNPKLLEEYVKNTYQIDKNKNGADEIADIIAENLGVKN